MTEHLKLDRIHTNTNFGSWRLGADAVQQKRCVELPYPAYELRSEAIDFLHTRSSVLHNYLPTSQGRIFTFLKGDNGALLLSELKHYYDTENFKLHHLASIALGTDPSVGITVEDALEPSISVITPCQQEGEYHALVSSGNGDLRLLVASESDSPAKLSEPVHPLRPSAPLTGKRPFRLEQAYQMPTGQVCCICWAVRSSSANGVACAEVFAIILDASSSVQQAAPQLAVSDVVLLRRCALPPYAVLCDPDTNRVLMAVDPAIIEDDVEHVECRHDAQQSAAAMPTDDGDDVDPRTLAEAAARLAKFTSQATAKGPLPPQQWADIYKESGPDGLGAMGSEPACELTLLQLQQRQASSTAASVSELQQLSCGACKLLAAESRALGSSVLGLTDDVDCALVELAIEPAGLAARHVASVPALAYIAAGKVQRKHLLLGAPSSSISAVLVEGQRYLYIYTATAVSKDVGQQQVVDMELGAGETVMGARLLPGGATSVLLVLTQHRLLCYQLA